MQAIICFEVHFYSVRNLDMPEGVTTILLYNYRAFNSGCLYCTNDNNNHGCQHAGICTEWFFCGLPDMSEKGGVHHHRHHHINRQPHRLRHHHHQLKEGLYIWNDDDNHRGRSLVFIVCGTVSYVTGAKIIFDVFNISTYDSLELYLTLETRQRRWFTCPQRPRVVISPRM